MQNDYIAIFMLNFYKLTFIPCLIGPSQVPPEKVDTYLAPVVKELNQLWEGVEAIDDKGPFTLKAVLMWGIHDYPGMRPNHKTLIQKSRTAKIAILQCAKPTTSHIQFAGVSQKRVQLYAKQSAKHTVSHIPSQVLHLENISKALFLLSGTKSTTVAKRRAKLHISHKASHGLHLEKILKALFLALGNEKYHSREAACETQSFAYSFA